MAKELGKDKLTMLMPEELRDIPLWAEQLFEESLGKDGKGITLFYGENITPEVLRPVNENDRLFFRINLRAKKTKEELEKEWQEFTKEQEKALDELLIEKGIKKQETIKIGNT